MSESVAKLKELLFAPESEAIATLSQRIDAVFDRAGTNDRFQSSVAQVLDGALRDAEVAHHDEMATAIAPLIVKTVKTEIHNSTDDLVEALYPATGRMVKAYVASAIKDMTDEINRKLEANPVMLRLNALTSGRSAGELALADSQRLKVEDVFLIRRATGELVARWPQGDPHSNLDHVMGGVLTAINEFTSEAFKTEGSSLRQIDLGDSCVYLRVSPAFLLAAKCSGSAPIAAEQAFDEEFLALIDRHHAALDSALAAPGAGPEQTDPLLQDLSTRLEARLGELQPGNGTLRRGVRPLTLLATLVGLPLAGWLAWSVYIDYRVGHVESVARSIVDANTEMQGYPNDLKVSERGRVLTISGLTPTQAIKTNLIAQLRAVLPQVDVRDSLSAVPTAGADVRPLLRELKQDQRSFEAEVKAAAERQSQDRAQRLMERTGRMLRAWGSEASTQDKGQLSDLAKQAEALSTALKSGASSEALGVLVEKTQALASGITTLALGGLKPSAAAASLRAGDTASAGPGDALVDAAGRAANAAQALIDLAAMKSRLEEEAERLRAQIAAIPPPIKPIPAAEPSPREDLERFVRSHAIFFVENSAFRDESVSNRVLDDLARLMKRDGSLVRIIGFTDDAGTPAKNTAIAKSRAETVAAALVARGIASNRLVTLNRIAPETNVSPVNGTSSANRRVEFEAGFIGEGAP